GQRWRLSGGVRDGTRGLRRRPRQNPQFGRRPDRWDRGRGCRRGWRCGRGRLPSCRREGLTPRLHDLLEVFEDVEVEATALRFSAAVGILCGGLRSWTSRRVAVGRRHRRPNRRGLGGRRRRCGRAAGCGSEGGVRKRWPARWSEEPGCRWRRVHRRHRPRLLLWHGRRWLVEGRLARRLRRPRPSRTARVAPRRLLLRRGRTPWRVWWRVRRALARLTHAGLTGIRIGRPALRCGW